MLSDNNLAGEDMGLERLNPCSNGICSLTTLDLGGITIKELSLNPCSNGICSLTKADPLGQTPMSSS